MKNAKYLLLVAFVACLSLSFVGCSDDDDPVVPPPAEETEFEVATLMSVATAVDANPEIVRMVPGSNDQAVFIASGTNQLFPITYAANSFTIGAPTNLAPGSATAEMTSIDVSPVMTDGENYVAVCVAEVDCAKGWILLVKLSDGTIAATVQGIGYNPDGCAFTKDGEYLIVACEDDREDRPCKPVDRHGGSFSIIDLRTGVANATLVQDYLVDWDVDSEPEHCETSSNGTVVVSVQETSQIVIFNTADLPLEESDLTIVDLPTDAGGNECEPDGLYISPDGNHALISNERNGTFQMMELPSGTMLGVPYTIEDDISAPPYNVDARKATKRTEPEECSLVVKDNRMFAVLALQESHAVVVYDVTDPANPVFDSIAPAGIDYANDIGMEKSTIGSEGLAAHPTNGVVFSANEREGSITMYKNSWAQ